jgi:hypothetical protein
MMRAGMCRDNDEQTRGHLAGQQLVDDQAGLDRLAQPYVICNEHAYPRYLQGHDHRHQLVVLGDDAAALEAE